MYQIDFDHPISVYFIGIGGISMSGLAEILLSRGFTISGSDRVASPLTELLEKKGATVHYGQRAENINPDIDLVVYTAAISKDNPEWIAMEEKNIPRLSRQKRTFNLTRNTIITDRSFRNSIFRSKIFY